MHALRKPFLLLMCLGFPTSLLAAGLPTDDANLAPAELVRRAVQNEISANKSSSGLHFMFKDLKKTPQWSETKLIVETRDATAGMLILQNGHPLTPQQQQAEEARLANYVQHPQELRKKHKQEKDDADHTERILRALPDAFLYERDATVPGSTGLGKPGDELIKLNFRPNPKYVPPTHVEQVLTGMYGHLLIDCEQERLAEIDGTLQKQVEFGWGILGHLDPGGRFFVQQSDVGDRHWEVTHMELAFTGKILFVKKLNIRSSDTFSDFTPVPGNLTFAEGVELLKKQAEQNHSSFHATEGKQSGRVEAENYLIPQP
jgi:hypothetical protein